MAADTAIQRSTPRTIEIEEAPLRNVAWTYRPSVDIFDAPEELLVVADVPGATRESIEVTVESGVLTIQAQVPARGVEGARAVAQEYGVGNFHRRFEIDDSIDEDGVSAEYHNGTLTVHLPKVKEARRRRVPVTG